MTEKSYTERTVKSYLNLVTSIALCLLECRMGNLSWTNDKT